MLSLVLGASTHSFELMLATFILGLALGGLAVRRRVDAAPLARAAARLGAGRDGRSPRAATLPVYDLTFGLMEALMKGLARTDTGYLLFNLSGAAIAALVMLPATFCAGMTLPLLTGALLRRGAGEAAIGQVYAANTLGAIAGVLLAVHVGLPLARPEGHAARRRAGRCRARPRAADFLRAAQGSSSGPRRPAPPLFVGARARRASSTRTR